MISLFGFSTATYFIEFMYSLSRFLSTFLSIKICSCSLGDLKFDHLQRQKNSLHKQPTLLFEITMSKKSVLSSFNFSDKILTFM